MKSIIDAHELEYEEKPEVVIKTPGRVHLIGEHSWFFKDKTLSMAMNLSVYISISKRDDSGLKFYFHQINDRKKANISSVKFKKEDKWANAVKAIVYGYLSGGYSLKGMNITIYSEILPSAGFGVTTAIKVGVALGIRKLLDLHCNDAQLLQVIERGNRRFLQSNNYIADNFAALFSKKDNLIITDHSKNTWGYVPYSFSDKKIFITDLKVPRISIWNEESLFEPQYALLLGDLRETKNKVFGGWQYINDVTDINEVLSVVSEDIRRKLLCIMREHGDVIDAVDGLEKNDFFKFARSVNHSHESMRDYYDLSCPEIDWILKRVNELEPNLEMISNPVSCGRITGKGFARCLYAIIRECDVEKFKSKLVEYEKIFGFTPECYEIEPSDGASEIILQ